MSAGLAEAIESSSMGRASDSTTAERSGSISSASDDSSQTRGNETPAESYLFDDPRVFNEVLGLEVMAHHLSYDPAWWGLIRDLVNQNRWAVDPVNAFALDVIEREGLDTPLNVSDSRREEIADSLRSESAWKRLVLKVSALRMVWDTDEARFIDGLLSDDQTRVDSRSTAAVDSGQPIQPVGIWLEVRSQITETLRSLARRELSYLEARFHGLTALFCAYTGDEEGALEHALAAERWALLRANQDVLADVWEARIEIALTRSEFEKAYSLLSELPDDISRWTNSRWGTSEIVDFADACQGVGRPQDAASRIRLAQIGVAEHGSALLKVMQLCVAEAVIEEDVDAAEGLFLNALRLCDEIKSPFEVARVRVFYAQFLSRRRRDSFRARAQVLRAIPDFEALGAAGWEGRARRNLATYREAVGSPAVTTLSRQERLVASMAAQGLTNKQIGEKLFISSRTVSYHLYNVFPKLGITSRAALRDALSGVLDG